MKMKMKKEQEEEIPLYKREKRYEQLPIIISPLINGEDYMIIIKAKNYHGEFKSKMYGPITPKGIPPIPKIIDVQPRDGYIKLRYECEDYSTLEYRANYEIISEPLINRIKSRRLEMKYHNLDNGTSYKFLVRSCNKEGKSEWSIPTIKGITAQTKLINFLGSIGIKT